MGNSGFSVKIVGFIMTFITIYQQIWCSMHWLKVKSKHGFTQELVWLSSFTFAMKQFWGVGESFCGYYRWFMDGFWRSALDRSGQIVLYHSRSWNHYWLVVSTPLKNISQLGWLFPIYIYTYIYIYGNNPNIPNHQPAVISWDDLPC